MKKTKLFCLVFSLIAFHSSAVFGWGDLGHETTAEIAGILLRSHPEVLQKIQDIIGVEPLAVASVWPDHVKEDSRFSGRGDDKFDAYHYVTLFRDPTQTVLKDAFDVLDQYPAIIRSKTASIQEKMIALRYVIHVVGDLHMPLHAGNEFDRGGSSCKVHTHLGPGDRMGYISLHTLWDTNLVDAVWHRVRSSMDKPPKYSVHKALAPALMGEYQDIVLRSETLDKSTWINESHQLHNRGVYPDKLDPDKRLYCNADWALIPDSVVPTLDDTYLLAAQKIVERRLVAGGVRLAAYLKDLFKGVDVTGQTDTQILRDLDVRKPKASTP